MKLQMENLALIHRGIILSDWETLAGAGVGANDTLVLMNIKFGKAKRRFERLALLNTVCTSKMHTNCLNFAKCHKFLSMNY